MFFFACHLKSAKKACIKCVKNSSSQGTWSIWAPATRAGSLVCLPKKSHSKILLPLTAHNAVPNYVNRHNTKLLSRKLKLHIGTWQWLMLHRHCKNAIHFFWKLDEKYIQKHTFYNNAIFDPLDLRRAEVPPVYFPLTCGIPFSWKSHPGMGTYRGGGWYVRMYVCMDVCVTERSGTEQNGT